MKVTTINQLTQALQAGQKEVVLANAMVSPNPIRLAKGQAIKGADDTVFLSFINGDGLELAGDNTVDHLMIQTRPDRRAIYLVSDEADLGTIRLTNLTVTGNVQILTRTANKSLNLEIDQVDIVAADARSYSERPMKYGVIVYQGALTVYNFSPKEDSLIKASITNVSLGRKGAPVIGSGLFISGFGESGGQVLVDKLTTQDIYANGMIPSGQPNLITGGIFIVYGTRVKDLHSKGSVTTYGTNDMVLDVWGKVDQWLVDGPVTSYGASGIGFVNFGEVDHFQAKGAITTYGLGARGFNQYDGTIQHASFKRIETFGDGSIGMQYSKPVGTIIIEEDVVTHGSLGETLVKGQIKELQADGISVLEGGHIDHLQVKGDIRVLGDQVVGYHINGGKVDRFDLGGKIQAPGQGSKERQEA